MKKFMAYLLIYLMPFSVYAELHSFSKLANSESLASEMGHGVVALFLPLIYLWVLFLPND